MAPRVSKKSMPVKSTVGSAVADAISALRDDLGSECREVYENAQDYPGLAASSRIETMGETADALEAIEDVDVPDHLSDLGVEYTENQRKGVSRSDRRDNAVNALRAAEQAVRDRESELGDVLALLENRDVGEELSDFDQDQVAGRSEDELRTEIDECDAFAAEIAEAADVAEGVEFPGRGG